MNGKRTAGGPGGQDSFLPRLVLLAAFFAGGLLLGQVLAAHVPSDSCLELRRYLADFLRVEDSREVSALLSTCLIYFRYPLLALFLGFASVGVVLLPALAAAFGAFLSFSVCCFTAAFGSEGVVLALAVFGLRCLVTLPCFFLLAVPSWGASAALASLSIGRGRRAATLRMDRAWWLRLGGVMAALLAGVCLEWLISPRLVRFALARVLI